MILKICLVIQKINITLKLLAEHAINSGSFDNVSIIIFLIDKNKLIS